MSPEEVNHMVDSAIKKAREDAMADFQVQLQAATQQATMELNEAKREIKRLRKNINDLSAKLEAAEQKMLSAHQTEFERAGHKKEIVRNEKDNQEMMISIIANEQRVMTASHAEEVTEMQERLPWSVECKEKEGGDCQGELKQSIECEEDSLNKVIGVVAMEDKKSTIVKQISPLQPISSEQKKEDEARLDAALSLVWSYIES